MLLGRQRIALGGQLSQTATDAETSITRLNNVIDVAVLGSLIGIGKQVVVLLFLLGNECLDILTGFLLGFGFLGVENGSGTGSTHYGNL